MWDCYFKTLCRLYTSYQQLGTVSYMSALCFQHVCTYKLHIYLFVHMSAYVDTVTVTVLR